MMLNRYLRKIKRLFYLVSNTEYFFALGKENWSFFLCELNSIRQMLEFVQY